METLSAREKALHEQMVEAATEPERLLALDAELRGVVAEREDVELEWLAAAEAAEVIASSRTPRARDSRPVRLAAIFQDARRAAASSSVRPSRAAMAMGSM